jgi:hypothetical protein
VALAAVGLLGPGVATPRAQAGLVGQWRTLPYTMPINPVHIALLNTGMVLVVSGSGNVATETNFRSALWDPAAGTIAVTSNMPWDMFCNGMVTLPDGRVFVNGGNLQYDPFHGELRSAVYDPASGVFTDVQNMAHGRWYPTVTTLGDGRVMTFSGLTETGATNTAVEFYTAGSGWSGESAAGWTPPLYPRMHLLTDGRVLYSGSGRGSRIFNPATKTWTAVIATMNYANSRTYGTSVLLPLSPADNYRNRVMIFGGGNPSTNTTEIIDPLAPTPAWTFGPPMSQPRIEMNATILPNGKVLATGGSLNDEDAATASLNADLYDPATNTFSSAGQNAYARLYHSNSLLLPDGTVALAGGNPVRGTYEARLEIYSPAYLFNADGTPAPRPAISGVSSPSVSFGDTFQIFTPDAASIASAVLIRPGTPTHAFDMNQRMVKLSFTSGAGMLTATAPPNGNVAPPGYYMLFVLNGAGVPSVATFVQLGAAPPNQAPTATIVSPSSNVSVTAGQAVTFAGSGSDPDGTIASYAWTFPGGNPSSSAAQNPGDVVYSTPGTFTASLRVTDNGGSTSQPAARTITVPDFSLGASPSSQTVAPGGGASCTASVTPVNGFTGTVNFGVAGLPSGATATFTPTSVNGSGSSTLSVTTSSTTPPGSYPLTVSGTSGIITHTTTVTLVVSPNFTISATPSTRTVSRNGATTYTVTIGPSGFVGTVSLSASGIQARFATMSFNPSTVVNTGSSVLTVDTKKQITRGTYTITINGTSGGQTRSTTVALTVQ